MNYDEVITKLTQAIKEDKTIIQPWRNKSIARLEEAQAFIRMGKTSTSKHFATQHQKDAQKGNMGIGPSFVQNASIGTSKSLTTQNITNNQCTCPSGARNYDCPVHGYGSIAA